jgi:hypothetical protein
MHLWTFKIKIDHHYVHLWTLKIKIDTIMHLWAHKPKIGPLCKFMSYKIQNKPTSCELPRPKQTSIMHLWAPKVKWEPPLCIFVNSYNQIKCPLCIFVSSQTKSKSDYLYNLWAPKTKIGPQYALVSSLTFSHFVFSCKVFNLSHPHMPFMIAWKNSLITL